MQTCSHYPYIQFLKGTGLEIKFLHIKWQTTALNRTFLRWGSGHSSFFSVWFQWGTYVTLFLLPIAVIMLIFTIFETFFRKTSGNPIMEPVIPGVTLPASELGYYSLTLIISSIVHEAGHAIAAVREDVHLSNVGVRLFFILPVAYVSLNTEDIQKLSSKKALKIFCAGVWHNVVLSLGAYVIYLILPIIFSLLYNLNNGVIVTNIAKNSPLKGENGILLHDKIMQINDCMVTNSKKWYECLQKTKLNKLGFCVTADAVNVLDETSDVSHISNGEINCCAPGKFSSVCFEYIEHNDGIVEIPPHSCLPVRPVIEKSLKFCNIDVSCPEGLHCIKPLLNNSTHILKITCLHKDVIYMGHPYDLLTVHVSSYIPKYKFISSNAGEIFERFIMYIALFSFGFAVINVIPCFFMDGQHIISALLNYVLTPRIGDEKIVATIALSVTLSGTFFLFCFMIYGVWTHLPL